MIKLIIYAGLTLSGVGDSAGGSSSRIFELVQSNKYDIELPQHKFSNNYWVKIGGFCDDVDKFKTIKKYPKYDISFDRRDNEIRESL